MNIATAYKRQAAQAAREWFTVAKGRKEAAAEHARTCSPLRLCGLRLHEDNVTCARSRQRYCTARVSRSLQALPERLLRRMSQGECVAQQCVIHASRDRAHRCGGGWRPWAVGNALSTTLNFNHSSPAPQLLVTSFIQNWAHSFQP